MAFGRKAKDETGDTALAAIAGDPTTSPDRLVELESSAVGLVSEAARDSIISRVLMPQMYRCADLAVQRGDLERAEFWFVEVATAPPPAGPEDLAKGAISLCNQILFPQRRFNEARIYLENAAGLDAARSASTAELMLTTTTWALGEIAELNDALTSVQRRTPQLESSAIEAELTRAASMSPFEGVDLLVDTEDWMKVDLDQPGTSDMPRQAHYDRLTAFLVKRNAQPDRAQMVAQFQADYLPVMIGYLLGLAPSVAEVGTDREVAARALRRWYRIATKQETQPFTPSPAEGELAPLAQSKTGVTGYGSTAKETVNRPDTSSQQKSPAPRLGYGASKNRT